MADKPFPYEEAIRYRVNVCAFDGKVVALVVAVGITEVLAQVRTCLKDMPTSLYVKVEILSDPG